MERQYTPLEGNKKNDLYNLEGFRPIIIDDSFLKSLGIIDVSNSAREGLREGSLNFQRLFKKGRLTSPRKYSVIDLKNKNFEMHNYTGMCPTNVIEVNPGGGSCSVSCLYCLVSDGHQIDPTVVYENYPELVGEELEKRKNNKCFFYLSPKIEAFSEPLLETGISHQILRTFIRHYEKNPNSKARLFIASKAGLKHLGFENERESITDLLKALRGKVQFNGSMGIMPEYMQEVLEPNSAPLESRLEGMRMLQEKDVYAHSVLVQPIIPCYFNELVLSKFLTDMRKSEIINLKPEFLTVNMENLAIISQYVNYFDKDLVKGLLELYVPKKNESNVKQRCRTAPDRDFSFKGINLFYEKALTYGIGVSVCNWVKSQLNLNARVSEASGAKGFRCLGYQEKLFGDNE